jgi:probable phosphoglycerate mutase
MRTHQTVAHFLDKGIPHESHAAFDEFDWGIHEGMQTSTELKKSFDEITEAWRNGNLDQGPPKGETPLQVMARQKEFWKHWLESEEELVLICMHGRCMRVFLSWLTGRGLEAMDTFDHSNTCLYHGWWDGEKLILEKENDTTHLD